MKCRNQGWRDGQNILKVVRIIGGRLNIPSHNQMKNKLERRRDETGKAMGEFKVKNGARIFSRSKINIFLLRE